MVPARLSLCSLALAVALVGGSPQSVWALTGDDKQLVTRFVAAHAGDAPAEAQIALAAIMIRLNKGSDRDDWLTFDEVQTKLGGWLGPGGARGNVAASVDKAIAGENPLPDANFVYFLPRPADAGHVKRFRTPRGILSFVKVRAPHTVPDARPSPTAHPPGLDPRQPAGGGDDGGGGNPGGGGQDPGLPPPGRISRHKFDPGITYRGDGLIGVLIKGGRYQPDAQPGQPTGNLVEFTHQVTRLAQLIVVRYRFENASHAAIYVEHRLKVYEGPALVEQRGRDVLVLAGNLIDNPAEMQRARQVAWGPLARPERSLLLFGESLNVIAPARGDLRTAVMGLRASVLKDATDGRTEMVHTTKRGGIFAGYVDDFRYQSQPYLAQFHRGEAGVALIQTTKPAEAAKAEQMLGLLNQGPPAQQPPRQQPPRQQPPAQQPPAQQPPGDEGAAQRIRAVGQAEPQRGRVRDEFSRRLAAADDADTGQAQTGPSRSGQQGVFGGTTLGDDEGLPPIRGS